MSKQLYHALLEDQNIQRWYNNLARGSKVTADVYLRRLGNFSKTSKISPKQLIEMNEVQLYNLLLDTVTLMEKKYAGSYIQSIIKSIKSWLLHNGVEIKREIKIKGTEDTPTLRNEKVPSQDELKRIFLSADLKGRVASVLVAHCGLRIESIGNYLGNDGLKIRDLPELNVSDQNIIFEKIPTLIIVRSELSKAGHQYLTFLSEEGCGYLKDYLEYRIRDSEFLDKDSAIVTPKQRIKPFIRATNVGDVIREGIRKAGITSRPYVLRHFFDTQLMLAESKGIVLRDYRQFWMGHKGDIEHRYTVNKRILPSDVVEDMRDSYKKSQHFFQTTNKNVDDKYLRDSFRKQLLLVAGFKPEEVDEMDLSMDDESFQETVRRRLLGPSRAPDSSQHVVSVRDVDKYLSKGWGYVANLPGNRVILKEPFQHQPQRL